MEREGTVYSAWGAVDTNLSYWIDRWDNGVTTILSSAGQLHQAGEGYEYDRTGSGD